MGDVLALAQKAPRMDLYMDRVVIDVAEVDALCAYLDFDRTGV
jgi:hypothetical protein